MSPVTEYIKEVLYLRNASQEGKEKELHHINALVMGVAAVVLILIAVGFYTYTKQYHILPPMIVTGLLILGSNIWLYKKPLARIPVVYNSIALALLGTFQIIDMETFKGSSLMWFILSPPMFMACLGLVIGTLTFMCFYLALIVLFFGPYSHTLLSVAPVVNLPRVFLMLFGVFAFSWAAEYVRKRIQEALGMANYRLEREARTDSLTGLGNRREFDEHFNWLQAQARRNNEHFTVAMADIDHFKRINDNHGHHVGDAVLHHVASIISTTLRSADRVFRWGGEEFAILMPSTTASEGVSMSERLRRQVLEHPYSAPNGLKIPLTISLGVYNGNNDESLYVHIKQVDARLYAAKNNGRNQVCSQLPDQPPAENLLPPPA